MPNANIFLFLQKLKRNESTRGEKMHTLTHPWQQHQKVMSLGIATRMLQLPMLSTLIINPWFVQT